MDRLVAAFGIDWKLLFAQGVNFAIVFGVLSYFLYKPALRVIEARRAKIAEGVRAAEQADRRLAEADEEKNQIVGNAVREAEGLVAAARTRAEERAEEIVDKAQTRADVLLKDAADRAEEAKHRVMRESEQEIARAAVLAAEKVLRKHATH